MSKAQIVLLPGAWHTPEHLEGTKSALESAGYTVHTRQLPSVGNANPPQDLTQDIAALQEMVDAAIGDAGNDVVVVPHSWSGIVASSGLQGYGKKEREKEGKKGGVVRCAYMCAFLVPEGVSLMDSLQGKVPEWWRVEGEHSIVNPSSTNAFYSDLPPSDQQKYIAMVKTHSFGTKKARSTGASWKEIPTWYLQCELDQAIPIFAQEMMVGGVKEGGGDIYVERIQSGHSPFLSWPEYTVGWIRRAAGEKL